MDGSDPVTEQEWRQRRRDPEDELDGGESLNQFYERVRATFGAIRSEHSSGTILIVGHSLTNQMILRALFGLTMQKATSIRQSNDELYLIELDAWKSPAPLETDHRSKSRRPVKAWQATRHCD